MTEGPRMSENQITRRSGVESSMGEYNSRNAQILKPLEYAGPIFCGRKIAENRFRTFLLRPYHPSLPFHHPCHHPAGSSPRVLL